MAAPFIFATAIILLALYLLYLKRHIDEWMEEKRAVEPHHQPIIVVNKPVVQRPITIIKKFEEKPTIVNTIIKVPRNDIDYIRLLDYIKYNRYYGRSYDKIEESLLEAGWDEITINRAFKELGNIAPKVDLKKQEEYNAAVDRKLMELKKTLITLEQKKQEVKPIYIQRSPQVKKIYIERKPKKKLYVEPSYFYIGSDLTRIYHTTKCRLGKSIKNKNKLKFKTALQAKKSKLRPCQLCEPNKNIK